MFQKLKSSIVAAVFLSAAAVTLANAAPAQAVASVPSPVMFADSKSDACDGLSQVGGNTCGDSSGVGDLVASVVTILSYIAGVAGVIMVVVSGFRFITSAGDSGKVASARSALVYALVGLAVAALAQFLVHFVLNTSDAATPCPSNSSISKGDPKCK